MPYTGYIDPVTKERIPIPGVPGESAYEAAVKGGYSGTKEEFYKILATIGNVSNPNLLINGDFSIWQKGTGPHQITGSAYLVDRWLTSRNNTGTICSVSKSDNGMKFTFGSDGGQVVLRYRKESEQIKKLHGKQVAITISIDNVVYTGSFIMQKNNRLFFWGFTPGNPIGWTQRETLPNAPNEIITIEVPPKPTGQFTEINFVKFELGDRFTGFYPTDPALELAKCQRYTLGFNTSGGWLPMGIGVGATNSRVRVLVPLPVSLRANPTVEVNVNDLHLVAGVSGVTAGITPSNLTFAQRSYNHVYLEAVCDNNVIVGQTYILYCARSGYPVLDAEIY